MTTNFDCIIIGAGPAGLTAALVLARAGKDALVIERGQYPGSKNLFGGVLYSKGLNELIPDFWKQAPVERPVARWVVSALNEDASFSMDYTSEKFNRTPYNALTVMRSRFDHWYAQQVEAEGATILTDTLVEDLLWEGDRVVGVKTGRSEGDLMADVVIAADGVNSLVYRNSPLAFPQGPDDVSLGVKEILAFPKETINHRFGLSGGEGAACTFVGTATMGIPGGAFIYTNKESISVGIVTKLSSLGQGGRRPEELLDDFKNHPRVWPLVKDGELREYQAHLIPEGYQPKTGLLYKGGLLVAGDAARFTLSTGLRVEGANYGIASGRAAAESVITAGEKKNFSENGLSVYLQHLKNHGIIQDMQQFGRAPHFFKNTHLYREYPEMLCHLGESIFGVEPGPKKGFGTLFKEALDGRLTKFQVLKDIYAGWRGLS
ncbi:FAD-dependent oxidoreductase [uncultured Desulfosarcina sp.]|uniref:FAD-dependent oxidoreductase n=1 Tax=uncultured Desulfosarcina sp. TaxID=218289 RepID=UPI0029C8F2D2|nr:FAD-dependent oxidoreductase [uncultured Desulfosarcina sp.]